MPSHTSNKYKGFMCSNCTANGLFCGLDVRRLKTKKVIKNPVFVLRTMFGIRIGLSVGKCLQLVTYLLIWVKGFWRLPFKLFIIKWVVTGYNVFIYTNMFLICKWHVLCNKMIVIIPNSINIDTLWQCY